MTDPKKLILEPRNLLRTHTMRRAFAAQIAEYILREPAAKLEISFKSADEASSVMHLVVAILDGKL